MCLKTECGRRKMDWIDLAQNRDTWWACVNAVMNFRFLKIMDKFSIS